MAANRVTGPANVFAAAGEFPVDAGTTGRQSTPQPGTTIYSPFARVTTSDVRPPVRPTFAPRENFSVRGRYEISHGSGYEISSGLNPQHSHEYLTLNSIGKVAQTAAQVMARAQADWNKVFPLGAKGSDGTNRVSVGQVFRLQGLAVIQRQASLRIPWVGEYHFRVPLPEWYNYVRVTAVTETTVVVHTLDWHILTGQVENGLFVDSTGEMWLYQKGTGFDSEAQRVLNYAAAPYIWEAMAHNIRELIGAEEHHR